MKSDFTYEFYCIKNGLQHCTQEILNSFELEELLKREIMPVHYYELVYKIAECAMRFEDFSHGEIELCRCALPLIGFDSDALDRAEIVLAHSIRTRLEEHNAQRVFDKSHASEAILSLCDSFEHYVKNAIDILSIPKAHAIASCEAGELSCFGSIKGDKTLFKPAMFFAWAQQKGYTIPQELIPLLQGKDGTARQGKNCSTEDEKEQRKEAIRIHAQRHFATLPVGELPLKKVIHGDIKKILPEGIYNRDTLNLVITKEVENDTARFWKKAGRRLKNN